MRSKLVLFSLIALIGFMAAAPSVASAQRIIYRDCGRYAADCGWRDNYDVSIARAERARARTLERLDRTAAHAARNAERTSDRAMSRAFAPGRFDRADFTRVDRAMRLRERLDVDRARRLRVIHRRW
jgi:hypothetical protein